MRYLCFLVVLALTISCTPDDTDEKTTEYVYNDTTFYGPNLLFIEATILRGVDFSLQGFVPTDGDLSITITKLSGSNWSAVAGTPSNWIVSNYDFVNKSQTFTNIENNHECECGIEIPRGTYRIDYYEGEGNLPTRTKEVKIN